MIDTNCLFCNDEFPFKYQIVSQEKHRTIVHSIKPIRDFHCIVVLRNDLFQNIHIQDLSELFLVDALSELGITLNKISIAIKKSSEKIDRVYILSLNSGENTKHLHFHVIPILKGEDIKKVNNIKVDGSGITNLSRAEIVQDSLYQYIQETCGMNYKKVIQSLESTILKNVIKNTKILKKHY